MAGLCYVVTKVEEEVEVGAAEVFGSLCEALEEDGVAADRVSV